jgi:hypothetical protein
MPAPTPRPARRALAAAALLAAAAGPAAAQPPGYGALVRHYVVAGCHGDRVCGEGTVDVWAGATDWAVEWNVKLKFYAPGYVLAFTRPDPLPPGYALDYEDAGATTCPRDPAVPGDFVVPTVCTHSGWGRAPVGYDMGAFDVDFAQYDEVPRPGTLPEQVNFKFGTLVLAPYGAPKLAAVTLR